MQSQVLAAPEWQALHEPGELGMGGQGQAVADIWSVHMLNEFPDGPEEEVHAHLRSRPDAFGLDHPTLSPAPGGYIDPVRVDPLHLDRPPLRRQDGGDRLLDFIFDERGCGAVVGSRKQIFALSR